MSEGPEIQLFKDTGKEQLLKYQLIAYILGTLIVLSNLVVVVSSGLILKKGQYPLIVPIRIFIKYKTINWTIGRNLSFVC